MRHASPPDRSLFRLEAAPGPRRDPVLSLTGRVRLSAALRDDSGAATAEYAIATLAAVGLAGLLVTILRGDEVRGMLAELVRRALSAG